MLGFMVLFSPRCELFLHKFLVKMIFFDSGVSSVFILRMVLQETFVILDGIYSDIATTGQKNPNYLLSNNQITVATDNNGSTISFPTQYASYRLGASTSTQLYVNAPLIIELDVVEATNSRINFYQSDSISRYLNFSSTGHYKFRITDNKVYRSINDGEESEWSFNYTDSFRIWLQSSQANATLKFKNLKVYSI